MKKILKLLLALVIIGLFWVGYQYWSITNIGENVEPDQADVIIILGAAVWPTGPSPALQARVYQGATIYKEGLAKNIILTGGMGAYPPTEAEAMFEAITTLGIPETALFLEDQATNTRENLILSKKIMDQQGWTSAIIVSDTFHLKRALMLAEDYSIQSYGAPAKNSVLYQRDDLRIRYTLREVLAITQYHFQKLVSM